LDNSKKLLLSIFIASLLVTAWSLPLMASGGGPCDDRNCFSFFNPAIIQNPSDVPMFRKYSSAYRPGELKADLSDVNAGEWVEFFNGVVPKDLMTQLLYKMTPDELANLGGLVEGQRVNQPELQKDLKEAFANYRKAQTVLDALLYLRLAKHVEPLALKNQQPEWSYPPKPPKPPIDVDVPQLIRDAEDRIPKVDRFIAARYRFQVLRLLFYSDRFAEAAAYYEKYSGTFAVENSVKYRFMEMGAGAYYKQKQYAKADYVYSLVYDKFPVMKTSSYFSFHPVEEQDWQETLALAKTAHEREVLWQLLGIYADGVAAIRNIYAINPKSQLLPLLLVREVNIAEESWGANQNRMQYPGIYGNDSRSDIETIRPSRLQQIKAIADAGNAYKPYLWLVSTGHLYALAGDRTNAEAYLNKARAATTIPIVRDQIRMSVLLARSRSVKTIDKAMEPFLAQELEWLAVKAGTENDRKDERADNLNKWLRQYLGGVYRKGGDSVRATMLDDGREDYKTLAGVDRILALTRAPNNAFDRYLVSHYSRTVQDLQELRGIHFLFIGDFQHAEEAFKAAGVRSVPIDADPFMIHMKDCLSCDALTPHTVYTQTSFVQRMQTLWTASQGRGQAAADASFDLANGYYNMSYYGNSRDLYDLEGSRHFDLHITPSTDMTKDPVHPALNMDQAEKYYLRAAELSTDREFKAKAVFMASKTEQNRSFRAGGGGNRTSPGTYFKQIRDSFADTQYYKEIIKECGYFAKYVK